MITGLRNINTYTNHTPVTLLFGHKGRPNSPLIRQKLKMTNVWPLFPALHVVVFIESDLFTTTLYLKSFGGEELSEIYNFKRFNGNNFHGSFRGPQFEDNYAKMCLPRSTCKLKLKCIIILYIRLILCIWIFLKTQWSAMFGKVLTSTYTCTYTCHCTCR